MKIHYCEKSTLISQVLISEHTLVRHALKISSCIILPVTPLLFTFEKGALFRLDV